MSWMIGWCLLEGGTSWYILWLKSFVCSKFLLD